MIEINYSNEKEEYSLMLSGHAHYARPGSDIVCAAVSMMYQSLANKMYSLKDIGNVEHVEIIAESGMSRLHVWGFNNLISQLVVKELFSMAVDALIQLSTDYPNNVKVGTLPDGYISC